ncbi:DNA mismatch repair protein MutS [Sulfurihydrogenibium subterraneum]|uniref:DNA mismatch repair protein MutS n=1 Tax=Sulfurihydrogenibium subterraneum TaxID=171121 RepID=UPI00048C8D5A|nr:DNA mismatch repair protein MutS [Sulfurihydrogenibium subterraneum]
MENLTPMVAQYHKIKAQYQDCLLLYRLGDFYELFYEDAVIGSKELNIVLTKKKISKDKDIPMCGIPYHSADSYITRLVSKGYKVAICEQLEDASKAKGVVKRDVIRVITPGTYFDNEKLKSGLTAVYKKSDKYAVAFLDLATGEFYGSVLNKEDLISFISKFSPKEILTHPDTDISFLNQEYKGFFHYNLPEYFFEKDYQQEFLIHFKTKSITSFGFNHFEEELIIKPLSAVFNYAKITQKSFLPYISPPKPYREDKYMKIDYSTIKHLELVSSQEHSPSLLSVINRAITGMGKRKIKFMLLHPLLNIEEIKERQDAVEELTKNHQLREEIRQHLDKVYDIERLVAKITSNTLTPKDMVALRESLKKVKDIKNLSAKSKLLKNIIDSLNPHTQLVDKLERYLEDNPPFHLKEGGLIKKGVDERLDELKSLKENAEEIIRQYQEQEKERTKISSLKIGFNKVIGYYIEITKPNLKLVPPDYKRKQTLSNAERFTTDYLQQLEDKILSADEKIKALEYEIFTQIREEVVNQSYEIEETARLLGYLDALSGLAQVAVEKGWIRPQIHNGYHLFIEEGYHPTVANYSKDFVPNSVYFDENRFFHIITGPNMSGKSTYIRQVALLTILSQIGSFIPATSAQISVVDAVYTRIGSGDNLAKGLSTFMVEMLEVANILNNATKNSLIVLDEVGRGTSTYDGIAIAWAVSEYIAKNVKAKTLFSTHYHELTQLENQLEGVKNFYLSIKEDQNGEVRFLYKVMEGFIDKSYGIHVAQLAGLPKSVIDRAKEILLELENKKTENKEEEIYQQLLFTQLNQPETEYKTDKNQELLNFIEEIDIATTTPLQALMILSELKNMVKNLKS